MLLPAGCLHDRWYRGSLGATQERNHRCLLGIRSGRAALSLHSGCDILPLRLCNDRRFAVWVRLLFAMLRSPLIGHEARLPSVPKPRGGRGGAGEGGEKNCRISCRRSI